VWTLKKSETAVMNYAAIAPLKSPDGKIVAKIYGGFEGRNYEIPVELDNLNSLVKKLLLVKGNNIYVKDGVLVIRNTEGNKLRIGGDLTNPDIGTVMPVELGAEKEFYVGAENESTGIFGWWKKN
jgi:hypothetical protein